MRVEVVLSREAATPDERAAWPDDAREEESPGVDDGPAPGGRTFMPW